MASAKPKKKKQSKNAAQQESLVEKRTEARRLYLERLGEISASELGRLVGANRNTVARWIRADDWDREVAEIKHLAGSKTVENLSNKLAERLEADVTDALDNMRLMNAILRMKLVKTDANGRPIMDETGRKVPNTELSPKELRALMSTAATYFEKLRLVRGESTENKAVAGEMAVTGGKGEEEIIAKMNETLEKIAKTGGRVPHDQFLALIHAVPGLGEDED